MKTTFTTRGNELVLSYWVNHGEGPEQVIRRFTGSEGGYVREKRGEDWKQVCKGLAAVGNTLEVGQNQTLESVIRREFQAFKRRDAKACYPTLVKSVGRPKSVDGQKVGVYLDPASISLAKTLGDGNVSEGVRKALAKAVMSNQTN